nr:filamentous hemagglutinin N-terminal domain-containing protein [Nostoc sp. ChiQUE02]MDZ8231856.1 filamentous hemagglutinin N-terminal domain-containing protein [Nostoc sp. ChiQUE02]
MSGVSISLYWWQGLGIAIASAIVLYTNSSVAQITPDGTLPNNSNVRLEGNTRIISGGTTRGANLFHSFREFSVPTGQTAFFDNVLDIQNIFTRVTGSSVSNINGSIRTLGKANLFIINPNGIIFGKNASLNIGGSFVATTANAIGFGNLGFFSASNPEAPSPLLTLNPNALLFNQIAAAPIQNSSTAPAGSTPGGRDAFGLRVPDGRSLLLVGGNVNMDGGRLNAFGGLVELGGLASAGTVGLNEDGNNSRLSFPNSVERSDVFLSDRAQVNVFAGNGGSITINARNLEMTGDSFLRAGIDSGLGSDNSKAGNISVNATVAINLNNNSEIFNQVRSEANGQGGDVSITANTLLVQDGAQVNTGTFGTGKGGNLRVDAQDVQLIGTSADGQFPSGLFTSAQPNSTGDAGDLTVKTNTLLVRDGAQVFAGTFGAGKAGSLSVDASDVQLIGRSADGQFGSGLFTRAGRNSTGNAGDITLRTNTLLVRDGAVVNASTFDAGNGGKLIVDASDVQLIGRSADGQFGSGLFTRAERNSTGNAGDLTVSTNTLLVQDEARVNVASLETGTAGNMTLNARSIRLNNNGLLIANTGSPKVDRDREQATININSKDLIMTGNSNIRTNATGKNVIGGNININTDILVGFENSNISANSANFRGGNIKINTKGIFGIQFRNRLSQNTSDITATGRTRRLSGNVQINTLDLDPTNGLIELPTNLVDVSQQISTACTPGSRQFQSSFVSTGRGGLPMSPTEPLQDISTLSAWVRLRPKPANSAKTTLSPQPTAVSNSTKVAAATTIVEATGWVVDSNGNIELVAQAPNVTPESSRQTPTSCPASR